MLKLNMGCGQNPLAGYVNGDKFVECKPDLVHDLEDFPWPWGPDSVDEVVLNHVLEHLGADPYVFLQLMQELYRVCAPDAIVHINVPHPRHDNFIGDPTHVRVITPQVLSLFSKKNCEHWAKVGAANSPLALYLGVDFEVQETTYKLTRPWAEMKDKGLISAIKLDEAIARHNNVISEIRMKVAVVKGAPAEVVDTPLGQIEVVRA
jgi:hypothetical protein